MKYRFLSLLLISLFITSCQHSTEELKKEVKDMIENDNKGELTVKKFILIHKDGNEYAGMIETSDSIFSYISVFTEKEKLIYTIIDNQ